MSNLLHKINEYEFINSENKKIKIIDSNRNDLEQELCRYLDLIGHIELDIDFAAKLFDKFITCQKYHSSDFEEIKLDIEKENDNEICEIDISEYQTLINKDPVLIKDLPIKNLRILLCQTLDFMEKMEIILKNSVNLIESKKTNGKLYQNYCESYYEKKDGRYINI